MQHVHKHKPTSALLYLQCNVEAETLRRVKKNENSHFEINVSKTSKEKQQKVGKVIRGSVAGLNITKVRVSHPDSQCVKTCVFAVMFLNIMSIYFVYLQHICFYETCN